MHKRKVLKIDSSDGVWRVVRVIDSRYGNPRRPFFYLLVARRVYLGYGKKDATTAIGPKRMAMFKCTKEKYC